jgi:hypothetical protein
VGYSAVLKGTPTPNCTLGNCDPIIFTILKPSDWEQGHKVGVKINGKGYDPGTNAPQVSDYQSLTKSFILSMRK